MTPTSSPEPPRAPIDAAPECRPLPERSPSDFAQLARRISSRTTDLLAFALVAVVLLTLGVQLTRWWRTGSPQVGGAPAADSPLSVWDDPSSLSLDFTAGDWALRRETVAGNGNEATAVAVEHAQRMLDAASSANLPPVDPAEQQWLDRLRNWPPQLQTEFGDVSVLGGPWPWVVATASRAADESGSDSQPVRRVVGWAFALPQSGDRWTMYVARRNSGNRDPVAAADDIPLPSDASSLLTVRSANGGFTAFRCPSDRGKAESDWDRRLTAAGWSREGDWQADGGRARARYRRGQPGRPAQLDALLAESSDGATVGVCEWNAGPANAGVR